jgi:hypothetical protein
MSYASAKGYRAEADVVAYLNAHGHACWRRDHGQGDVDGVPFVVSVKDWREMRLAKWIDEMVAMVERSPWDVGAVVHKRARKGDAGEWYATMPVRMWLPQVDAYVNQTSRGRVPLVLPPAETEPRP